LNYPGLKVLQILYSGLGGHGSVVFSLLEAGVSNVDLKNHIVFYGIENVKNEYKDKCHKLNVPFDSVVKKEGLDMGSYKKVFNILKKEKPDVILLHSVNLIVIVYLACLFRKTRIISIEHQANQLKNRKDWIYTYLCMFLAHKVVYLTSSYQEQIKTHLRWLFKSQKSIVIPNGIDIDYFSPRPKMNGECFCGMLSRLNSLRDHVTLIEAISLLKSKNVKLLIGGDGPTLGELKKITEKLDVIDFVKFLGLLEGNDVLEFFHKINIYVHASFGETMSTSLMQAMACGLPVIASDVDGINNMIDNGKNGLLVPLRDKLALASALVELSENAEYRKRLSHTARQYAIENFSNKVMFDRYFRLIKDNR